MPASGDGHLFLQDMREIALERIALDRALARTAFDSVCTHGKDEIEGGTTMWPDYRIQNLFGIELPIIQAPMAGVGFSEMAVGVSEAGGLGSLACALLTTDQIIEEVNSIRRQTSQPINLN